MLKKIGLMSVICLAVVLPAVADATVKCESSDGRYHECGVGAAAEVKVLRQLSKTECRRGVSWGYLNGKIWVDDGCRAEFLVESAFPVSSKRANEHTIVCESVNGRRKHCAVDASGGVRMTRRLSDAACDFKNDWDYDEKGVWVRHGCRAEFVVTSSGRFMPQHDQPNMTTLSMPHTMVTCESKNGRRQNCAADTRYGVSLNRQLSDSDCVLNRTWGFNSNGIWVSSGCRGEFAVNHLVPQTSSTNMPSSVVRCESKDNGHSRCAADTRFGVAVYRQLSKNDCVLNSTWGFDSKGVWVSGGCRADFVLNP